MANLGLSQAANNFVNMYTMRKQDQANQAAAAKNEQIKSLMGSMLMGNATPEQTQQLAQAAPDQFVGAQNYLQSQQAQQAAQAQAMSAEEDERDLTYLMSTDDTLKQDEYLKNRIATIEERGGDATDSKFLLNMPESQRKNAIQMIAKRAGIDPLASPEFEQGTGDMSGYAFNPSTGEYIADEALISRLEAEAAETAKLEGILTGKDLAGVNDKVTSLVSGAEDIVAAANSLEDLEKNATPAAQLAAVFKFMKANDPTSTVREGEQGQVYAAEGAMKGFAAQINQMLGKGGLSEENFKDLVGTAKIMANSAADSTGQSVNSYLTVLEDSLSAKAFKDLKNRVPKQFELAEEPKTTKPTPEITVDDAMKEVDSIMQELGI